MTLYIAKGGVLKGSANREDYLPLIKTRFEGWEFQAYGSLNTIWIYLLPPFQCYFFLPSYKLLLKSLFQVFLLI
jgi:hypothetical protein